MKRSFLWVLLLLAPGGSITFLGQSNRNAVLWTPCRCPIPWRSLRNPHLTPGHYAFVRRSHGIPGPQPSLSSQSQRTTVVGHTRTSWPGGSQSLNRPLRGSGKSHPPQSTLALHIAQKLTSAPTTHVQPACPSDHLLPRRGRPRLRGLPCLPERHQDERQRIRAHG